MNFKLKEPCKECPYLAQMPGWIGSHESALEFHTVVLDDVRFSCHMTHNENKNKEQHCAGYALYMNAICKLSKDNDMLEFQNKLSKLPQPNKDKLLESFDGSVIVKFHGR